MENLKSFIESGILESYVVGTSTTIENDLVDKMAAQFREVGAEIELVTEAFEWYALSHAKMPNEVVKPFLMATIDYSERLKNGEQPSFPPELSERSSIADYSEWINRPDMMVPPHFNSVHAKIIGYTPALTSAIVWIKDMAPQEVHDNEYERFLILEGACDIVVEKKVYHLVAGDYFPIPLHKYHQVNVTSSTCCKIILQRVAA